MLTVWGRVNSINVQKVLWTLAELGLAYRRIDAGMAFGVVGTPHYLAMNPNALIPTIDDDGYVLVGIERHRPLPGEQARHGHALPGRSSRAVPGRAVDGLAGRHAVAGDAPGVHRLDPHPARKARTPRRSRPAL